MVFERRKIHQIAAAEGKSWHGVLDGFCGVGNCLLYGSANFCQNLLDFERKPGDVFVDIVGFIADHVLVFLAGSV